MKIEFYNCPEPDLIAEVSLPEAPAFLSYKPDFKQIDELVETFKGIKNLVVVGHGGSISTFYGLYNSLREKSSKQVYFVSTVDPDYISEIKNFVSPSDTLVLAISKSGETVTQLEALFQFEDFPLVVVTGIAGPLVELAVKLKAKTVMHPTIGGRFTGLTEVALLPAALCGFDTRELFNAGREVYQTYSKSNSAFEAASRFSKLEEQGIVDVFMPFYDSHLFAFSNLIVQLCHESFGKDGKGQTYFAHTAPESQHHTNQRFFGGRNNIAGWFTSVETPLTNITTTVPASSRDIPLKDGKMDSLGGIPLFQALQFELQGTLENAKLKNIPVVNMSLSKRDETELGKLIVFWQLYAVYSSVLRGVNPFDQPEVENSKKISFDKRLQYKGLL